MWEYPNSWWLGNLLESRGLLWFRQIHSPIVSTKSNPVDLKITKEKVNITWMETAQMLIFPRWEEYWIRFTAVTVFTKEGTKQSQFNIYSIRLQKKRWISHEWKHRLKHWSFRGENGCWIQFTAITMFTEDDTKQSQLNIYNIQSIQNEQ